MKQRLATLHTAIVEALAEADALSALFQDDVRPAGSLIDAGIGLDKARHAVESLLWPTRSADDVVELDSLN